MKAQFGSKPVHKSSFEKSSREAWNASQVANSSLRKTVNVILFGEFFLILAIMIFPAFNESQLLSKWCQVFLVSPHIPEEMQ